MLAGHARTEISPLWDCPLIGYDQRVEFFPDGGNAGLHDALLADVLVLADGPVRAAVVTLDLCILENPLACRMREIVGAAANVPPEAVILACSHTHSGPYAWEPDWKDTEPVPKLLHSDASIRYSAFLCEAIDRTARLAASDLRPVSLSARASLLGIAYCRRVRLPNGEIGMAWNLREWDGPDPHPSDDPALQILVFHRRDATDIVLWNTAAHPVVLGKRSNVCSADWPGAARAQIEAERPGTRVMFLHGAGGDAHPWLATGEDPADLKTVAAPAAALVRLLLELPASGWSGGPIAYANSANCSALRIGPARLLAVPFELFGTTGATLRAEFPNLLLATTANGWRGYLPPKSAFAEGGYEVEAARVSGSRPGDCESLLEESRTLLRSL